jgi:hypothetical protein
VENVKDVGCGLWDVDTWGKVSILHQFAHITEVREAAGAVTLSDNSPHFPMHYYYD